MIEHVNFETQRAALTLIARLLRDDGMLIISTPNPEVTCLYGENPYHLREMSREEFLDLLSADFVHIHMLEQRVRESVTFDDMASPKQRLEILGRQKGQNPPLAYIAFCSQVELHGVAPVVAFNESRDVIHDFLGQEQRMNLIRLTCYDQNERLGNQSNFIGMLNLENASLQGSIQDLKQTNASLQGSIQDLKQTNASLQRTITEIRSSNWYQLGMTLRTEGLSWRGMRTAAVLVAKMALPKPVKRLLRNAIRSHRHKELAVGCMDGKGEKYPVYHVKHPAPVLAQRPCIVHVIGNFCLGGSSRLVVDLIEHLGQFYDNKILTSYAPTPPAYQGVEIDELSPANDEQDFAAYFESKKPAFIHLHYWGDCDESWYTLVIKAAERLGIRIVENVNTPISPYLSPVVCRYVYVSDYVRRVFGQNGPEHITIYTGSNFSLFTRAPEEALPENCIGMVYRLESDKLNEASILPLIRAVQKRPGTKALIVGGGSLLEPFQKTVQEAGLSEKFEFTGYVSYDSLPEYYRRMTVFVAPVWKESFGQVSPFAMNMRIPVCGYDVGAIREITDDSRVLAPDADADGLADIIVHLLDDAEERRSVGEFQHQRAQSNFSVEAMVNAYAKLYRELTGVPE